MNLQLQDFEGPFDLLLHLVRQSKVDIYSINIRDIIDQYLAFINSIDKYNIDASSEYLVIASELVHLKSKMLINKTVEDETSEEEYTINSEEDLRQKLIEYERYKSITDVFKSLEDNRSDYFTKVPENLNEYIEDNKVINTDFSVDDLLNAFLEMQKRIKYERPSTMKVARKEYSIKERISEIRNILREKKYVDFFELFQDRTKNNLVVTLLSVLDMCKNNEINIKQNKAFGNITIESVMQ